MKTILISTTTSHNPGDEIIKLGVAKLLRQSWGEDIQFVHYDRNPDLQIGDGDQRSQRAGLVGNYATPGNMEEVLRHCDAVVLAGSPEWCGMPLYTLYNAISRVSPTKPLYALGIGCGSPWTVLSPLDKTILSRPQTRIVTRSVETTAFLQAHGIESVALPCPAIMAYERSWARDRGTLIIAQKPGHGWHEVQPATLTGLDELLACNEQADILCVHVKEFLYYKDKYPNRRVLYASNEQSFFESATRYTECISTRLHGAIAALSLGIPTFAVSAPGDFRIRTAVGMFGPALPVAPTFVGPFEHTLDKDVLMSQIKDIRREVMQGYSAVLR